MRGRRRSGEGGYRMRTICEHTLCVLHVCVELCANELPSSLAQTRQADSLALLYHYSHTHGRDNFRAHKCEIDIVLLTMAICMCCTCTSTVYSQTFRQYAIYHNPAAKGPRAFDSVKCETIVYVVLLYIVQQRNRRQHIQPTTHKHRDTGGAPFELAADC